MAFELGYDFKEAISRQNISQDDLTILREAKIPLKPADITDKQLALFLDACDTVESTKNCIQSYYSARNSTPEHFSNRDPNSKEIQQCLENQDYFFLPPTPSGFAIIFHRLSNSKLSNYHFDDAIKTFFMTIDACLYKLGPRPGMIFIFDMSNVRLGHLTRVRIGSIKKFFHYLQEGLPGKLCQIHIFNVVSFFDKIISLIKPFMKAEIFKSLYTYSSDINMEEFYEKWVSKECLPSDLGGDLPSIVDMHAAFRKEIMNMTDYFVAEEQQRIRSAGKDEDKVKTKFSSLEID